MNRVELVGRLTKDPELRTVSSGNSVATFTVAINRPFTPQNGEREADFINCRVWNKQAENLAKYCHKGDQIGVEGSIRTSSFDGQDGNRRYVTEVNVDRIEFLSNRGGTSGGFQANNYDAPESNNNAGSDSSNIVTTDVSEDPFKDFGNEISLSDDDLPF